MASVNSSPCKNYKVHIRRLKEWWSKSQVCLPGEQSLCPVWGFLFLLAFYWLGSDLKFYFACFPPLTFDAGKVTHIVLNVIQRGPLHMWNQQWETCTQMPKGTWCVSLRQCLTQYQCFDIEKRKPKWILITCLKRVGFAESTWVHADITGQKYSTCELDINDMLMIWCRYSGHICDDYVCQRCLWIFISQGITLCQDFIADINLYMHDWCQVDLNRMLGVEVCAKKDFFLCAATRWLTKEE